MNPTATFIFGFLTGAAAMLVVLRLMLSEIEREVRRIHDVRELEREIERNHEQESQNQHH
jgi:hypothetical protein